MHTPLAALVAAERTVVSGHVWRRRRRRPRLLATVSRVFAFGPGREGVALEADTHPVGRSRSEPPSSRRRPRRDILGIDQEIRA